MARDDDNDYSPIVKGSKWLKDKEGHFVGRRNEEGMLTGATDLFNAYYNNRLEEDPRLAQQIMDAVDNHMLSGCRKCGNVFDACLETAEEHMISEVVEDDVTTKRRNFSLGNTAVIAINPLNDKLYNGKLDDLSLEEVVFGGALEGVDLEETVEIQVKPLVDDHERGQRHRLKQTVSRIGTAHALSGRRDRASSEDDIGGILTLLPPAPPEDSHPDTPRLQKEFSRLRTDLEKKGYHFSDIQDDEMGGTLHLTDEQTLGALCMDLQQYEERHPYRNDRGDPGSSRGKKRRR